MNNFVLKNNLKKYRKKFRITQDEMAIKLDIKRSYYSDIERGVYVLSTMLAFQISKAINDITFEKQRLRTRLLVDDLFYIEDIGS
ncbi:MAG: helix-turn-helix transcriptional regulator [Clostridia bacterium]|nr:helix-turn-helix transcriptional regulator [Clostridia bacterium]MDD4047731.1 helix-turn-helix transcriptional regulator [Clostridia bacterium]